MASTYESPQKVTNRTAVALLLAAWLEEHGRKADDVEGLAEYGREAIVKLTRYDGYVKSTDGRKLDPEYIPSDATWAAAMTILRAKEAHPGPFDGFPS